MSPVFSLAASAAAEAALLAALAEEACAEETKDEL